MGWMAALGGAAAAGGSTASAIGNAQSLRDMRKAFGQQMEEEDAIENDWRAKLRAALEKSAPREQAATYRQETDAASSQMNALTEALIGAADSREAAGGPASGRVTTTATGLRPRLRMQSRALASKIGQGAANEQQIADLIDLSGERSGMQRKLARTRALYPYRRGTAATRGANWQSTGQGLTQLGQALMMSSANAAGTGGETALV